MTYSPRHVLTPAARAILVQLRAEIVRAGWCATARRTGYDRSALARAFPAAVPMPSSTKCPNLATVADVAQALGFDLVLRRKAG